MLLATNVIHAVIKDENNRLLDAGYLTNVFTFSTPGLTSRQLPVRRQNKSRDII